MYDVYVRVYIIMFEHLNVIGEDKKYIAIGNEATG